VELAGGPAALKQRTLLRPVVPEERRRPGTMRARDQRISISFKHCDSDKVRGTG